MNKMKGFVAAELIVALVWITVVVGGIIGWVLNIIKLVGMLDGPVTAMFIARCIGVFAAPLGAILGYLG